jgi:hypothetical protein
VYAWRLLSKIWAQLYQREIIILSTQASTPRAIAYGLVWEKCMKMRLPYEHAESGFFAAKFLQILL